MPSRILRDGIVNSERVNKLSAEEEVFYRRLMSKVDDHGLFDARSSVLRTSLYPLRVDLVSESNCEQWLTACINAGLVVLYHVPGKPFLKMLDTRWKARSSPKFVLDANSCKQLRAPVPLVVVVDVCRCRLIEDVVVDVLTPVDNSTRPPVDNSAVAPNPKPLRAESSTPGRQNSKPVEKIRGKTYAEWAKELGIAAKPSQGFADVKLAVDQALAAMPEAPSTESAGQQAA